MKAAMIHTYRVAPRVSSIRWPGYRFLRIGAKAFVYPVSAIWLGIVLLFGIGWLVFACWLLLRGGVAAFAGIIGLAFWLLFVDSAIYERYA
jgi:hypothetical protein